VSPEFRARIRRERWARNLALSMRRCPLTVAFYVRHPYLMARLWLFRFRLLDVPASWSQGRIEA